MDVVDEMVLHSSLVCLIITSLSERSLHPSLTEARGSHVIQGFVRLQPPDQVTFTTVCWFEEPNSGMLTADLLSLVLFVGSKSRNVTMSDPQKKLHIRGNLTGVRPGGPGEGDGGIYTPRFGGAVGARCARKRAERQQ